MKVDWTPERLIAFEKEIATCYNRGEIRAPLHLSGGNEEPLIALFRERVDPEDWVLGSWRMHYHCLLKGVSPARLRADVLAGRSIALHYPEHRILSSALVGGVLPIAVGLALGIRRKGGDNKVVCFLGDMTAETGAFHECVKYAANFGLPLLWVVEDNGMSIFTRTREAWGRDEPAWPDLQHLNVIGYRYRNVWPHYGTGRRVSF